MTRLPRRPRLARPAQAALAALGLLTGLALGCKGGLGGDSCVSTREYFADEVWTNVMSRKCITCHGPAGIAEEQNAEFRLLPSSYPGFMDANFEAVSANARPWGSGTVPLSRSTSPERTATAYKPLNLPW